MNYPISLVTITYNAQDRIKEFLEYHRNIFSEIVVIDQGSTDNTKEIAESIADFVVTVRNKGFNDADRQYAFSLASNPWVLYLDDDEFVSGDLMAKLDEYISSNIDIFWFVRQNLVDGVDIKSILGDDIQCRLFKQGAVRWPPQMHSFPVAADNAKVAYVREAIIHKRTYEGLVQANKKREQFASPEARKMQDDFLVAVQNLLKKEGNA